MEEIRNWLRENAKQVKGFDVDETFHKGAIVCHEREDLGPKGYNKIERKFKSFSELKEYYGQSKSKVNIKKFSKGRAKVSGTKAGKRGVAK